MPCSLSLYFIAKHIFLCNMLFYSSFLYIAPLLKKREIEREKRKIKKEDNCDVKDRGKEDNTTMPCGKAVSLTT